MVLDGDESQAIAVALHAARIARVSLPTFPGPVPQAHRDAYRIQAAQSALRQEPVTGWKVAMVAPEWRDRFGAPRLVGPVFRSRTMENARASANWQIIPGGFAAVEAEFMAVIGRDAPRFGRAPHAAEVTELIKSWHAGAELAGSPLATINALGPTAVVADCGNNDGIVLGQQFSGSIDEINVSVAIDGEAVGQGTAANIAGGPISAVAFLITHLEQYGQPIRAGQIVSTGAITGIHPVKPGQRADIQFGRDHSISLTIS